MLRMAQWIWWKESFCLSRQVEIISIRLSGLTDKPGKMRIGTYALSHRMHGRHAWDFIRFAAVLQGNYERALAAARAAAAGQTHSGRGGAHRMQATISLVQKALPEKCVAQTV